MAFIAPQGNGDAPSPYVQRPSIFQMQALGDQLFVSLLRVFEFELKNIDSKILEVMETAAAPSTSLNI